MIKMIVIFFLGVITGAVGLMVISCLWVDSMNHKRELTKEEWKMGIHPDRQMDGGLYVVAYMVTAVVVFGALLYVIGNK